MLNNISFFRSIPIKSSNFMPFFEKVQKFNYKSNLKQ